MSFIDKVKDFGEDIKKTVEDSDIKDKAKSAGMIITDAVGKGKKNIENKLEENRQKIEAEREYINNLQNAIAEDIENNYKNNSLLPNYGGDNIEMLNFADEYYEKIITLSSNYKSSDFTLGNFIATKHVENITSSFNKKAIEEDEVENPLVCYYKNSKEYFLLTDKSLYLKGTLNSENKLIAIKVESEYLKDISIVQKGELSILKINNVDTIIINCNNLPVIIKCLGRIAQGNYTITENDISEEIKSHFSAEINEKINDVIEHNEFFTFLSKKISLNLKESNMICTNKRIITINTDSKSEIGVINTINYDSIVYIGLDNGTLPIINLLQDLVIEIIVDNTKLKIDKLTRVQADRVIFIINKYKRELNNNGFENNYEDKKGETSNGSNYSEVVSEDIIKQIRNLAELRKEGIVTEEEFQEKKKELLSRI